MHTLADEEAGNGLYESMHYTLMGHVPAHYTIAGAPRGAHVWAIALQGAVRHLFTHRDVTAQVFRVEAAATGPATPDRRWVPTEDLASLGVSSFTRKTLALGLG